MSNQEKVWFMVDKNEQVHNLPLFTIKSNTAEEARNIIVEMATEQSAKTAYADASKYDVIELTHELRKSMSAKVTQLRWEANMLVDALRPDN